MAGDLWDGAIFASRLMDPLDAEYSPKGQAAWDQVFRGAATTVDATTRGISKAGDMIANPRATVQAAAEGAEQFLKRSLEAPHQSDTFTGELERQARLGLDDGQLAFDLGSLLYGGLEARGVLGLGKLAGREKYISWGLRPGAADYFATRYTGIGHHVIQKNSTLPKILGGGPYPNWLVESPLMRVRPQDIETGEFFRRHHGVDNHYQGGKVPAQYGGGGWSGKKLGWQKYVGPERVWFGTPTPVKVVVGSTGAGVGMAVDYWDGAEPQP